MEKKDYIIVGLGIAGISICEQLRKNNKSFIVFDANTSVTKIAGGTVHPCILKYFTLVWNGTSFYNSALPFYKEIESFLASSFTSQTPILKVFNSIEEQNLWSIASDKKELEDFLNESILPNDNNAVNAEFGFGKVNHNFQINTKTLIESYRKLLLSNGSLRETPINYDELTINPDGVNYNSIEAKKIIFSEGPSVIKNPLFPKAYLIPKKGEYITIKAPRLNSKEILKSKFFVIPLGKDIYKVGATFAHNDHSNSITEKGKNELVEALEKLITVPFEVINQEVGMRPTVKDRRPLLGNLSKQNNVYFYNGLGTRGLLMAPLLSEYLFNYIEEGINLPSEIDINRFS